MGDELGTFGGSCHCGDIKFNVKLNVSSLTRCNCSICSKLGALWAFAPKSEMVLLTDQNAFGSYQFGDKTLHHHFCKNCGIEAFAEGEAPDGTPTVGINVRCLDDFDISGIPISDYDGKSA